LPDVSVVVASHERAARLRILLDALAAQTLPRDRWELIVVHTYDADTAATLLERHELAQAGLLRHLVLDPSRARPSIQRNVGWRAARAPRIAFIDDDCRPSETWLERLLARSEARPGAIVQGATRADPHDEHEFRRTHFSALHVDPPNRFMQTCNILYETEVLERIEGFDERAITGEDIDLGVRAQDAGAALTGAPDALVYHAIVGMSTLEKIRSQRKWQHLAYVVKKHPRLRRDCAMGIWWKPEHLGAVVALLALAGAPRRRWMLAGALPYVQIERRRHGPSTRQQLRAVWEIPPHWVVELAEVGTFVRGSLRYRTVLL
jgi:GT2 family glycosyltransferase